MEEYMLQEMNVNKMQSVNGGIKWWTTGHTTQEGSRACNYGKNIGGSVTRTCANVQGTGAVSVNGPKEITLGERPEVTISFEKQPYARNISRTTMNQSRAEYEMWRTSERNSQR
jgi:hypothetical protein